MFELNELKEKIVQLEKDKQEQDCLTIIKESYEKRFNILIRGLREISGNAWEKPIETLEHVHKFMKDGLHISDPKSLPLADYHRLHNQYLNLAEKQQGLSSSNGQTQQINKKHLIT